MCAAYRVPFVINDNVEIARTVGADGVHVGQDDMPAWKVREILGEDKIIGVSAQTVEQAIKAEKDGSRLPGSGSSISDQLQSRCGGSGTRHTS